jgi:hypothetical protein
MPGWSPGSWGYQGDDGRLWEEGGHHIATSYPTYGSKDVVGCGVDCDSRSVFFTKNGVRLGDANRGSVAFHMVELESLYPVIAVGGSGTEVSVNFGDSGAFVYQG